MNSTHGAIIREGGIALSHAPETHWYSTDFLFVGAYALVLVAIALSTPLQIPELLGIGWSVHYTWPHFLSWISQSTDPSPLGYFIQFPFVFLFGTSRLGVRVPGLLFAIGSALLFLQLTKRTIPQQRYTGLFLFLLMPLQLLSFTSSIQFELGTFFVLLAMLTFIALVEKPSFRTAAALTVCTLACLFTDHHAGLPVFGAVLFLARFCARPQQRKALWFALGSCVLAVAPYVPYYFWAATQANPHWLSEPKLSLTAWPDLSTLQYVGAASIPVLCTGVCLAGVASFQATYSRLSRRLKLFCLLGSVLLTLGWLLVAAFLTVSALDFRDLMYVAPMLIVLFAAGVRWAGEHRGRSLQRLTTIACAVLMVCFAAADTDFLLAPKSDVSLEARYLQPELKGESCVIFVSEFFSRPLFLLFQPQLEQHECTDFFRHRIVLAIHPYVRPDEVENAESVFTGLNYTRVQRVRAGGGQIIVYESAK